MPLKKKEDEERTDEEWAQLVADKVNDSRPKVDVTVGEPTNIQRKTERSDEEWAKLVKEAVPATPIGGVEVKAGEPEITKRNGAEETDTDPEWSKKMDRAKSEGQPLWDRRHTEGGIYLQNTRADGSHERGQQVLRKMFKSDDDFDKFVSRARSQGNVWDEPAPEDKEARGLGGRLGSLIRSTLGAAIPQATGKSAINVDDVENGYGENKNKGGGRGPAPARLSVDDVENGYGKNKSSTMDRLRAGLGNEVASQATEVPTVPMQSSLPNRGPDEATYTPSSSQPTNWQDVAQNVLTTGKEVGNDLINPMATWGRIAGGVEGAAGAIGQAMGPAPQPPPAVPAPGLDAGSSAGGGGAGSSAGGMSASMRGPVANAPAFPEAPNHSPEMQAAVDQQLQAIQHSGEIDSEKLKAQSKVFDTQLTEQAKQAKRIQDTSEYVDQRVRGLMDSTAKAQEILNNPAQTPDPERYWQNHSRIMFAIGVGMLAQAGRDIGGVLNNVNTAIDRDVEAQKNAIEAPRNAARAQISSNNNMVQMFQSYGHDIYESTKLASAVGKDFYAKQVEKIGMESGSQDAANQAALAAGKLREGMAKDMADAEQHARHNAVEEYNARTNRMEATAKISMQGRGGSGAGKPIPPHMLEGLAALQASMEKAKQGAEMYDAATNNGNILSTAANTATKHLPPSMSKAGDYQARIGSIRQDIALAKEKGVVRREDDIKYGKMIPDSDIQGGKVRWEQLQKDLDANYRTQIDTLRRNGHDVSQFEPSLLGPNTPTGPIAVGPDGVKRQKAADGKWYPVK